MVEPTRGVPSCRFSVASLVDSQELSWTLAYCWVAIRLSPLPLPNPQFSQKRMNLLDCNPNWLENKIITSPTHPIKVPFTPPKPGAGILLGRSQTELPHPQARTPGRMRRHIHVAGHTTPARRLTAGSRKRAARQPQPNKRGHLFAFVWLLLGLRKPLKQSDHSEFYNIVPKRPLSRAEN